MIRVAFDIGGVLSKYPEVFRPVVAAFLASGIEVHVVTDMHDRDETLTILRENGFGAIQEENVHDSDYESEGEFCKATILRRLGIDLILDDFPGYLTWDSRFGPAPVRCLVMPDPYRPYWAETWRGDPDAGEFGRRAWVDPE